MLKRIIDPNLYHGRNKTKNYFEGWYYKIVDNSKKYAFAFIPGISFSNKNINSHAFIQFLRGDEALFNYIKYDVKDFSVNNDNFNIRISDNNFTLQDMEINIKKSNLNITGNISFKNISSWQDSFLNPGSMGYYNYIPFMECYSQVCAIDMDLHGMLKVNNEVINFNEGKGYIEKNWGSAFPTSWIWIQCNCFKNYKAALSCSIGEIPFLHKTFRGFIIGFLFNNKFYKFTTMNKSKVSIKENKGGVELTAQNLKYRLIIKTFTEKNMFIKCFGPKNNDMSPFLEENLMGIIKVQLFDLKNNKIIFEENGECAGIEYGGEQKKILDFIH